MTKTQTEAERLAEEFTESYDRKRCLHSETESYLAGFKAAVEQAEKIEQCTPSLEAHWLITDLKKLMEPK